MVLAGAHQDVLSLPQQYPKSKWSALYFIDGESRVHLFGKAQSLFALFKTQTSASLGLPNIYKSYEIHFEGIQVEQKEIEHILKFINVEHLLISDQSGVIWSLIERIEQLKELGHLKHLELSVPADSYQKLDLTIFLKHLPSLKVANFHAEALTDVQFVEFVRQLDIPKGWSLQVNHKWIAYTKKAFYWPFMA